QVVEPGDVPLNGHVDLVEQHDSPALSDHASDYAVDPFELAVLGGAVGPEQDPHIQAAVHHHRVERQALGGGEGSDRVGLAGAGVALQQDIVAAGHRCLVGVELPEPGDRPADIAGGHARAGDKGVEIDA